jgi:hypothetical protein
VELRFSSFRWRSLLKKIFKCGSGAGDCLGEVCGEGDVVADWNRIQGSLLESDDF